MDRLSARYRAKALYTSALHRAIYRDGFGYITTLDDGWIAVLDDWFVYMKSNGAITRLVKR